MVKPPLMNISPLQYPTVQCGGETSEPATTRILGKKQIALLSHYPTACTYGIMQCRAMKRMVSLILPHFLFINKLPSPPTNQRFALTVSSSAGANEVRVRLYRQKKLTLQLTDRLHWQDPVVKEIGEIDGPVTTRLSKKILTLKFFNHFNLTVFWRA